MNDYDEPVLDERTQRYNNALSRYFEAYQVGSESMELTTIVHHGLHKIFSELQEYKEEEKEQAKEKGKTISHEDCTLNEINDLQSPQHLSDDAPRPVRKKQSFVADSSEPILWEPSQI
ncbi:hypothetical protein PIB30_066459 [Stylosanthes scabra]|uniref:Uncharacterized protein n=1 Tax=Stylosanthes scabra TaxID=79078 RepID=A0ABU6RM77_9FABA|nr:hypothetical protein [Stylosanthes scabra]